MLAFLLLFLVININESISKDHQYMVLLYLVVIFRQSNIKRSPILLLLLLLLLSLLLIGTYGITMAVIIFTIMVIIALVEPNRQVASCWNSKGLLGLQQLMGTWVFTHVTSFALSPI